MVDKKKNNTENNENPSNHAWRYFELHACQRISLIRYFVIVLSLYVTGSGYLIAKFKDKSCMEEEGVIFFSMIFIIISIIFWWLDNRNRKLIHIAEDSLREYEQDSNLKDIHKIFFREKNSSSCTIRHTFCFRALFIIAILSACIIGYYSWNHMSSLTTQAATAEIAHSTNKVETTH
jgi:hypothetical protein